MNTETAPAPSNEEVDRRIRDCDRERYRELKIETLDDALKAMTWATTEADAIARAIRDLAPEGALSGDMARALDSLGLASSLVNTAIWRAWEREDSEQG